MSREPRLNIGSRPESNERTPDHEPLSREEMIILLQEAKEISGTSAREGSPEKANRFQEIRARLMRAIPGMTEPKPSLESIAGSKAAKLDDIFMDEMYHSGSINRQKIDQMLEICDLAETEPYLEYKPCHEPLSRAEVVSLLKEAMEAKHLGYAGPNTHENQVYALQKPGEIQGRLVLAIPGITDPEQIDGPVARKIVKVGDVYVNDFLRVLNQHEYSEDSAKDLLVEDIANKLVKLFQPNKK